jgi:hypothetical protein
MSKDRLSQLLQRYVDGLATPEDVRELNDRLRQDPQARRELIEIMNVDSALAAYAESVDLQPLAVSETESNGAKPWHGGRGSAWLVSVICVMVVLGWSWWSTAAKQPWATIENEVGAAGFVRGTQLRGERVVIDAGLLQLETARGAHLVIEAPADFEFESEQRLRLRRGRLSADVPPPAQGFTVMTPSGDAVDLGTRFGVDVPQQGAAEIHVFQGEVIAKTRGAKSSESLRSGDAMTMHGKTSTVRELRSSAFIQMDEMSELTAAFSAEQRERAEASMAALKRDSALIALLDFEADDVPEGVFRMAQGRWPGSHAPEFVNIGDHMRVDVGGERAWPQLTLAAWVRLDRLGAPYQSLLHTDGWDQNNFGQVHWMVNRYTTMRLALFGNTLPPNSGEIDEYPDSRTSVLPEQGRWMHLATVYDSDAQRVRFYLNGEFDKQASQVVAHPAMLGPAQIGNWDRTDRKLSGRIDELLLLGRAMSDVEIQALYAAGCPYQ